MGTLKVYRKPEGLGVRVDDGYEEGMEIPLAYDSMISKLITYGKDREEAIERMLKAIDAYEIAGFATTLGFGRYVLQHPAFLDGSFSINFVEQYFSADELKQEIDGELAEGSWKLFKELKNDSVKKPINQNHSAWKRNRVVAD